MARSRTSLRLESGDEESACPVDVWERQEELRPPLVPKLRPLVPQRRVDREAGRLDHGFVLVHVQRADAVDDRAAVLDALCRGPQERELELRQWLRTPAKVRPGGEDAEPGARRVD